MPPAQLGLFYKFKLYSKCNWVIDMDITKNNHIRILDSIIGAYFFIFKKLDSNSPLQYFLKNLKKKQYFLLDQFK